MNRTQEYDMQYDDTTDHPNGSFGLGRTILFPWLSLPSLASLASFSPLIFCFETRLAVYDHDFFWGYLGITVTRASIDSLLSLT